MSADNVIYVGQGKDSKLWYAWHDFASNDWPSPYANGHYPAGYKTVDEAVEAAWKIYDKRSYVEYGVQFVKKWDKETESKDAIVEVLRSPL